MRAQSITSGPAPLLPIASAPRLERARCGIVRVTPWSAWDNPAAIAQWNAVSEQASEPNPFFESWYLLPALRALDTAHTVRLLTLEIDGKLAGLIPLARELRYYRWPIPHWRGWVHPNCFLGTPLVAQGAESAFWRALLDWADSNAGIALFLHLGPMPLDGPMCRALDEVLGAQSRLAGVVHREDRALLASELSPQDYWAQALSGKKRKELRRQSTRLTELGEVRIERATDTQGLEQWLDQFLTLEASGWKGKAGSALASHSATTALFRESLSGAAALGRLERLQLTLDAKPIAMLASFLTPPGAFSYKTAFDEAYARFSPGVLLQRENLEVLTRPEIAWTDSCAAADHPMIDHLWRERRTVGHLSIAIGSAPRRALFARLLRAELVRSPV